MGLNMTLCHMLRNCITWTRAAVLLGSSSVSLAAPEALAAAALSASASCTCVASGSGGGRAPAVEVPAALTTSPDSTALVAAASEAAAVSDCAVASPSAGMRPSANSSSGKGWSSAAPDILAWASAAAVDAEASCGTVSEDGCPVVELSSCCSASYIRVNMQCHARTGQADPKMFCHAGRRHTCRRTSLAASIDIGLLPAAGFECYKLTGSKFNTVRREQRKLSHSSPTYPHLLLPYVTQGE